MIRHPSRRKLTEWLSGAESTEIDNHLATCEACAAKLEEIDQSEQTKILGAALTQALAPPEDMAVRLEAGVAERLDSRQALGYLADLFGAGMQTTRLLLTEETDGDN